MIPGLGRSEVVMKFTQIHNPKITWNLGIIPPTSENTGKTKIPLMLPLDSLKNNRKALGMFLKNQGS
jgi:hypothetical protein